jgi:hypothetical protein
MLRRLLLCISGLSLVLLLAACHDTGDSSSGDDAKIAKAAKGHSCHIGQHEYDQRAMVKYKVGGKLEIQAISNAKGNKFANIVRYCDDAATQISQAVRRLTNQYGCHASQRLGDDHAVMVMNTDEWFHQKSRVQYRNKRDSRNGVHKIAAWCP